MTDIALSALVNVRPLLGSIIRPFVCAEVVDVGEAVYLNTSGKVALADADAYLTAKVIGVIGAIGAYGKTTSVANEQVDVVLFGPVAGWTALTPGEELFASIAAGAIEDATAGTGDFRYLVGWAVDAETIFISPFTDDVAVQ